VIFSPNFYLPIKLIYKFN